MLIKYNPFKNTDIKTGPVLVNIVTSMLHFIILKPDYMNKDYILY